MAVPSASCTYSWPVWTEDLKAGAPAALTGLASHSSPCMPGAHEPQLTAILEAACQPTDHLTAVDSELPLRRQLHSLASQATPAWELLPL